jgi:hypothetical protein
MTVDVGKIAETMPNYTYGGKLRFSGSIVSADENAAANNRRDFPKVGVRIRTRLSGLGIAKRQASP